MNNLKCCALSPLLLACSAVSLAAAGTIEDNMETVVVTATGSDRSTLLAPASLSVISREDLQNVSDQKLLSALRKTAGISLSGRGVGGRKVIQLRGLESHHSLILVDGKRVSATDDVIGHSDFQYEWLPLDSIERIEVIRGPMSALYGSEALGGVINIITRNDRQHEAAYSAMLGSGLDTTDDGGDEYSANVQVVQPVGESLILKAHVGHAYRDDVADTADRRLSSLEGHRTNSAQLGANWRFNSAHAIELEYLVSAEERGREPYYRSTYDLDRHMFSAYWKSQLGAWTGDVGYYRSTIDVINSNDTAQVPAYTPQYLTDDVVEARFHRDFGMSRLTLGSEWREEELEHAAFARGGDSVVHQAVLAQYETPVLESVYLTAGGRWDHHEYFGSEFSPRVYLVWELAANLSLKAGYGHGFKAPTLKQISPEYRFDGPHSFIGNEDVQPETSDSWEIGLRYEGDGTRLSAALFRNEVRDLIDSVCIDYCDQRFGHLNQYVNVERAEIAGLEFEGSHWLHRRLELHGRNTYTDAQNKTLDEKLTSRPRHQGSIGLRLDWVPDTLSAAVDWQYIGQQWVSGYSGPVELPGYSLLNASLNYSVGKHRFTLSATNLGDTDLYDKSAAFEYAEYGRSVDLNWFWQF